MQVVGTVFPLMETYAGRWRGSNGSCEAPVYGFRFDVGLEPIAVDVERMVGRFRQAVGQLGSLWDGVFAPEDLARLEELAARETARFRLEDDLWVRLVFDLACAYHRRVMDRDQLVRSALALYLGRVASFVLEVRESTAAEVDASIERLRHAFEAQKDYLVGRWEEAGR